MSHKQHRCWASSPRARGSLEALASHTPQPDTPPEPSHRHALPQIPQAPPSHMGSITPMYVNPTASPTPHSPRQTPTPPQPLPPLGPLQRTPRTPGLGREPPRSLRGSRVPPSPSCAQPRAARDSGVPPAPFPLPAPHASPCPSFCLRPTARPSSALPAPAGGKFPPSLRGRNPELSPPLTSCLPASGAGATARDSVG